MNRKDFAIFILSNGRPNNIRTLATLRRCGSSYPYYIVIDNEDITGDEYKNIYRDKVIVFDKKSYFLSTDNGDNFGNSRSTTHARNAIFDIASTMGYKYFLMLDDDYTRFCFKFDSLLNYCDKQMIGVIDRAFESTIELLESVPYIFSVCWSQGGDFIGGSESSFAQKITTKRKAMNSFFCCVDRKFRFISRLNEDVNTVLSLSSQGGVFITLNQLAIAQMATQKNKGGMTDAYIDSGTYVKSFYSVMYAPSCVVVTPMQGVKNNRLHHMISWGNMCPKIISQSHKKLEVKK